MTEELENTLFKKYPKIFPGGRDVDQTKSLLCFGCECDDGWYKIIDHLCGFIQDEIDYTSRFHNGKRCKLSQVVAVQVKEKFGSLRFYYDGGIWCDEEGNTVDIASNDISGGVSLAEYMSGVTCEHCGGESCIRNSNGWYSTICDKCKKKYNWKNLWRKFVFKMRRYIRKII